MKHWRWFLIGVGIITLMVAAAGGRVVNGVLIANIAALLWAARFGLILEPRWTIDDELETVRTWTL